MKLDELKARIYSAEPTVGELALISIRLIAALEKATYQRDDEIEAQDGFDWVSLKDEYNAELSAILEGIL